jgi:RNA polymerase sigma factor (sigma-70 family)
MAVTESGHLASREIDDLYRAHGAEVYRYAYAVLGNHADAEDVTQTTFLNAYRAIEQGVRPRKPSNWLLTIASNAIKQRFRQERSRPRHVELDDRIADTGGEDEEGPTVGELLTALSKIPPQQRQAIVLREFEGRSYAEIADILGVTTSALETLLFRARRSLAEELQHQLTCTEAQLAVSRAVDGRLGRKERRRLRDHLDECPDCARFARIQQRHRSALRGLALLPIPLSLSIFKGFEGTASAAVVPIGTGSAAAGGAAVAVGAGVGAGATGAGSAGGILAGGLGLKAAAVVAAASVAGGVGVVGATQIDSKPAKPAAEKSGKRVGQTAPRGVLVPGNGVAVGKASAPGQNKQQGSRPRGNGNGQASTATTSPRGNSGVAKANAPGQTVSTQKKAAATARKADKPNTTANGGNGSANGNGKAGAKGKATAPGQGKEGTTSAATGKGQGTGQGQPSKPEKTDTSNAEKPPQAAAPEPTAGEPTPPTENGNANGNAGGNGKGPKAP